MIEMLLDYNLEWKKLNREVSSWSRNTEGNWITLETWARLENETSKKLEPFIKLKTKNFSRRLSSGNKIQRLVNLWRKKRKEKKHTRTQWRVYPIIIKISFINGLFLLFENPSKINFFPSILTIEKNDSSLFGMKNLNEKNRRVTKTWREHKTGTFSIFSCKK